MKLFFISDIHGSALDLEQALAIFEVEQADYLVILGDVLYHGPRNPIVTGYSGATCSEMLNQYKDKIIAVRGNCDSEVDQMLLEFPITATLNNILTDDRRFFLSHGHIYNPCSLPEMSKNDVFCFGHVHLPIAEKQGDVYIFNPGSISLPKQNNPKSYGLFSENKLEVRSLEGELLAAVELD